MTNRAEETPRRTADKGKGDNNQQPPLPIHHGATATPTAAHTLRNYRYTHRCPYTLRNYRYTTADHTG